MLGGAPAAVQSLDLHRTTAGHHVIHALLTYIILAYVASNKLAGAGQSHCIWEDGLGPDLGIRSHPFLSELDHAMKLLLAWGNALEAVVRDGACQCSDLAGLPFGLGFCVMGQGIVKSNSIDGESMLNLLFLNYAFTMPRRALRVPVDVAGHEAR